MSETICHQTADGAVWEAIILPEHGANCVRLTRTVGGIVQPVLEDIELERILQAPTSYGMPILFPYAGRIAGGQFSWRGTTYRAEPTRHGLVRQRPWEVAERSGAHLTCRTTVTPSDDGAVFPFHFTMQVGYYFGQSGLTVAAKVTNHGGPLPYTFGLHPYFHAPHRADGVLGSVYIPATHRWELNAERLPTGQLIAAEGSYDLRQGRTLTVGETFDDVYTSFTPTGYHSRCAFKSTPGTITVTDRSSKYYHLCLYTPPQRQAICLEPYTGAPDAFNHPDDPRFDLRVVPAGGTVEFGDLTIGCSFNN